jgi:hypothetical protein
MKSQNFYLRRNLNSRKNVFVWRNRGAHKLAKGSGAVELENAIALIATQNLRSDFFDDRFAISSISWAIDA